MHIRYNGDGSVDRVVAGDRMTEYHYKDVKLGYIEHIRDGVSVKTSYHHNQANITFNEQICILYNEFWI